MDIDFASLLSNPLFTVGAGLLGDKGNNVAQNIAAGLQNAQTAQTNPIQKQILSMQAERLRNAMNFNPADYLQTTPNPEGTNASLQAAQNQLPAQMPAGIGGPIGGQTALPGANPNQIALNPAPGIQTNQLDLPAMISAGIHAGLPAGELQQIWQTMDPMTAARYQIMIAANKPEVVAPQAKLMTYADTLNGGGGGASNDNPTPESDLGQLMALNNARDAAIKSGNTTLANQLQTAIDKRTGAFEQGLTTDIQPVVDAIGHYNQAPLTGNAMRDPRAQKIMAQVAKQYPQYNAQNYAASQAASESFAGGPLGDRSRVLNVAINHLDTLKDVAAALGNKDMKAYNAARQEILTQGGSNIPTNFDTVHQIVANEVIKAVSNSGTGTQSERDELKDNISKASSFQQLAGSIDQAQKLLGGQLNGLATQYKGATMGRTDFADRYLTPRTQQVLGTGTSAAAPKIDPQAALAELRRRGAIK